MPDPSVPFWERPLETLNDNQWEQLCDGCGLCCLLQFEEEIEGNDAAKEPLNAPVVQYQFTRLSCKLYDVESGCCTNYEQRHKYVPTCRKVSLELLKSVNWLPRSCAYRLRFEGKPLYDWHHLISGDKALVHRIGFAATNFAVSELSLGEETSGDEDVGDYEAYVIADPTRLAGRLAMPSGKAQIQENRKKCNK